jgi:FHA domain/FhaA, N-terminal domain
LSVFDKVRKWIDGETAELVLEEAARDAQIKPRSKAEEFIVKIARAVEEVMQNEMVPLPQGTTIIPTEYIIFLSDADDKDWQGVKRRGLEQGLYHILAERAKEISGKKKLETQSFSVELRVDGTLEQGDVRVQHSWDDSSSNKTSVLARPKGIVPEQPKQPPPPQNQQQTPNQPKQDLPQTVMQPNFTLNTPLPAAPQSNQSTSANNPPPTVLSLNPQQVKSFQNEEAEELTHVQKRLTELYRLEIWRGGVRQNVVPIFQNEISIGRGSKSKPVDIPLAGDPEISRRHLTLAADGNGNYWATNEGRNAAMINNYELPVNQKISINAGVPIIICSYTLRIQPK